jgi:hypothetical protein
VALALSVVLAIAQIASLLYSPALAQPAAITDPYVEGPCQMGVVGTVASLHPLTTITAIREVGYTLGGVGLFLGALYDTSSGSQRIAVAGPPEVSTAVGSGGLSGAFRNARSLLAENWRLPNFVTAADAHYSLAPCLRSPNRPDDSYRLDGSCPDSRQIGELAFPIDVKSNAIMSESDVGVKAGNGGVWIGCLYKTIGGDEYLQPLGSVATIRIQPGSNPIYNALQDSWHFGSVSQSSLEYPLSELSESTHFYVVPQPSPRALKKPKSTPGSCYQSRQPYMAAMPGDAKRGIITSTWEVATEDPSGDFMVVGMVYYTRSGRAFFGLGTGAAVIAPMRGGPNDVYGAFTDAFSDVHVDSLHRPASMKFISAKTGFTSLPCTLDAS